MTPADFSREAAVVLGSGYFTHATESDTDAYLDHMGRLRSERNALQKAVHRLLRDSTADADLSDAGLPADQQAVYRRAFSYAASEQEGADYYRERILGDGQDWAGVAVTSTSPTEIDPEEVIATGELFDPNWHRKRTQETD